MPPPSLLSKTFPNSFLFQSFKIVPSGIVSYFYKIQGNTLLLTIPVKYDLDIIYCPKKHPLLKEKALKRSALNMKGNLFFMILDEAIPKLVVKKSYSFTSTSYFQPEYQNPEGEQNILTPRKEFLGSRNIIFAYYSSSPTELSLLIKWPTFSFIYLSSLFYKELYIFEVYPAYILGLFYSSQFNKFYNLTSFFHVYFFMCCYKETLISLSVSIHSSSSFATIFLFLKILGLTMKASVITFPFEFRNIVQRAALLSFSFLSEYRKSILLVTMPCRSLRVSGPSIRRIERFVNSANFG